MTFQCCVHTPVTTQHLEFYGASVVIQLAWLKRRGQEKQQKGGCAIEGGAKTVARCVLAGGTCQMCKLKRKPAPV